MAICTREFRYATSLHDYTHLTLQLRVALAGFDAVDLEIRISDLPPEPCRQIPAIRLNPHRPPINRRQTDLRLALSTSLNGRNFLYSANLQLERKALLTNGGREPLWSTVWRRQFTDPLTPHHLSCCFDQTVMPIATGTFTSFANQMKAAELPPHN